MYFPLACKLEGDFEGLQLQCWGATHVEPQRFCSHYLVLPGLGRQYPCHARATFVPPRVGIVNYRLQSRVRANLNCPCKGDNDGETLCFASYGTETAQ